MLGQAEPIERNRRIIAKQESDDEDNFHRARRIDLVQKSDDLCWNATQGPKEKFADEALKSLPDHLINLRRELRKTCSATRSEE